MSNHEIEIVKEFSRFGMAQDNTQSYPAQLKCALDSVVVMAERYEFLRTLKPIEFTQLWQNNIHGRGRFDDLVDEMMKARKK
jgi:hypothetical protein